MTGSPSNDRTNTDQRAGAVALPDEDAWHLRIPKQQIPARHS